MIGVLDVCMICLPNYLSLCVPACMPVCAPGRLPVCVKVGFDVCVDVYIPYNMSSCHLGCECLAVVCMCPFMCVCWSGTFRIFADYVCAPCSLYVCTNVCAHVYIMCIG